MIQKRPENRTYHLFFFLLLITAVLPFGSCARPTMVLNITPDGAPVFETRDTTVLVTSGSTITPAVIESIAGGSSKKDISVQVYVSLKYKSSEEAAEVLNIEEDTIAVDESFEGRYEFQREIDSGSIDSGLYWMEYVWIDDAGYTIKESETAVY